MEKFSYYILKIVCSDPWITWTPGSPSATLETFGGVFWQSSTDNINSDPDTFC